MELVSALKNVILAASFEWGIPPRAVFWFGCALAIVGNGISALPAQILAVCVLLFWWFVRRLWDAEVRRLGESLRRALGKIKADDADGERLARAAIAAIRRSRAADGGMKHWAAQVEAELRDGATRKAR